MPALAVRLVAVFALLALAAAVGGCGGGHSTISVRIDVVSSMRGTRETTSSSLECRPVAGTLPFAARICRDIARHRQAMLDPLPSRSTCAGGPNMPQVTVEASVSGRTSTFDGSPGCGWPRGTPLGVYWAAGRRDTQALDHFEPLLRCEDDPTLLAEPTPWASVVACTHGLWTPRSERLIRLAGEVPELAAISAARLFPPDVGVHRCAIPAGGPFQRTPLRGKCGVRLTSVWSVPKVSFAESWPRRDGKGGFRHVWTVAIAHGRPVLVGERGSIPPQAWR